MGDSLDAGSSNRDDEARGVELPPAWSDLIEGLTLLATHQSDTISPFHCEHDELTVMADPAKFTTEELARLDELGFHPGGYEETFTSFRFGSA